MPGPDTEAEPPLELVLGPLVRHVDTTSATIWVETSRGCSVTVRSAARSWEAGTFAVHGHHYALVDVDGLEPGSVAPYEVELVAGGSARLAWPPGPGKLDLPPSVISTLKPDRPPRFAFGSCRTSVTHDARGNASHGVDALRAYALAMAGITRPRGGLTSPDFVVFLGDQVYADETSAEMRDFISSRRDIDQPPGAELKDYEEYAHLYRLAWSDPANRWLLSTLPSAMIFDDHDVRDDWNTSIDWRRQMDATDWWHGRIVAALSSYWVYQHAGNLSPEQRAQDEIWQRFLEHRGPTEPDLSEDLDRFAARVDREPASYRWSFAWDLNGSRLVIVDSRAARVLEPHRRRMLDDDELAWFDRQMTGDVDHLFVGTSLPFLLPPGLQHLEAFSEALAAGAWGRRGAALGEALRQGADLEHWGAFQDSFREVARIVLEVSGGQRGRAPRTVTFLSGDVHHSYVSEVSLPAGVNRAERGRTSRVLQLVCSPIRNPLPRALRFATALMSYGVASGVGRLAARSAKVPEQPFAWRRVRGPWFDNNLATLEVTDGGLEARWESGRVVDGEHHRPVLEQVAVVRLEC